MIITLTLLLSFKRNGNLAVALQDFEDSDVFKCIGRVPGNKSIAYTLT